MHEVRSVPAVLERAGLSGDAASWVASAPGLEEADSFPAASEAVSSFLVRGGELARRLPGRPRRTGAEADAAQAIAAVMEDARERYLTAHTAALYDELTIGRTVPLRVEELLAQAAERVPGLVPAPAELSAERARALPDKEGIELAQGTFVARVLALPGPGRHLIGAMLRPTPMARDLVRELRATGRVDLGPVLLQRDGRAGILELRNPEHLNAEDDTTLGATECGVDLILLDPEIEVGVLRGGVVDHPRYPGVRVFGAGLNLTDLYAGGIGYLFYLVRDLGYVHKIYRGIAEDAGAPDVTREKPWIAVVERFAVGGACQLLHVVDHVIAVRGSRLFLPARKEGIIPGVSNLRLPRFVGDRAARQAIFSGREWIAGEPDAAALCDEVVDQGEADRALAARIEAFTDSGLVNAVANRRVLRIGQEPLEVFREYMAAFAAEQARCHLSPALVRNLRVHWNGRAHAR